MEKRLNPYQRLLNDARKWASEVICPTRRHLWTYPAARLANGNWRLDDLAQSIKTAKLLGFETHLEVTEDGGVMVLHVTKRPESMPWNW